jgi:RHS repeat-associated protein
MGAFIYYSYNIFLTQYILRVEKGEKLAVEVFAKYDLADLPIPFEAAKSKHIKALDVLGLVSVADLAVGSSENKAKMLNFNLFGLLPIAKKLVSKTPQGLVAAPFRTLAELQPQAYLQITTYKDSLLSEVLAEKRLEIGAAAQADWLQVADSVEFSENAFVVVSLKNTSDIPVLFDNLELRTYGTEKAVIIQENHYEPFGMTLKGLDYVVNEKYKNNYLYNGFKVERQEELDLFWDDSHARNYDMQTSRFVCVDPLSEEGGQESCSTYHYSYDNPVRYNDPDGKCPDCWAAAKDFMSGFNNAVLNNATAIPATGTSVVDRGTGGAAYSAGQTAGDAFSIIVGAAEIIGGVTLGTGGGVVTVGSGGTLAVAGLPAAAAGTAIAAHGATMAGSGLANAFNPKDNKGVVEAKKDDLRTGKDFTPKGKKEVIEGNKTNNGGAVKCENCGVVTVPSAKSEKGVKPPKNEAQVDHKIPKSKGGSGTPANGQVLCRDCNRQKWDN